MSNLDTIENIDSARAILALAGIKLESFECMRGEIDRLKGELGRYMMALNSTDQNAARYAWIREHPAWETECFLSGLTPDEFDSAIDKARAECR